jgi:hypothetical protein
MQPVSILQKGAPPQACARQHPAASRKRQHKSSGSVQGEPISMLQKKYDAGCCQPLQRSSKLVELLLKLATASTQLQGKHTTPFGKPQQWQRAERPSACCRKA